jgi:hypothetical protein
MPRALVPAMPLPPAPPGAEQEEMFHHIIGSFDVAKFHRLLRGRPGRFQKMVLPIDPFTFLIRLNPVVVEAMTLQRRDEPVFAVMVPGVGPFVIDGYHRMARRKRDGLTNVQAWVMPERLLPMIRTDRTRRTR